MEKLHVIWFCIPLEWFVTLMFSCASPCSIFASAPLDHDVLSVWNTVGFDFLILQLWFYISIQESYSCVVLFSWDVLVWFWFKVTLVLFKLQSILSLCFLSYSCYFFLTWMEFIIKPSGNSVFFLGQFSITVLMLWIDNGSCFLFLQCFVICFLSSFSTSYKL